METIKTINGLANIGNTCYMNSALQILVHCDVLSALVLRTNIPGHVSSSYQNFVKEYIMKDKKSITPRQVKKALEHVVPAFRGNNQQDAHEFIIQILDQIEEEYKKHDINKNMISNLFDCKVSKHIKSLQSKEHSVKKENIRMLCLPIPDRENVDIDDCLCEFMKDEILKNPLWETPSGRREKAIKRIFIDSFPVYLIFELKRYDNRGNKINKSVDVSRTWISNNGELFKLKGYILQSGSTMGGHYVAYICTNGKWFCCDDSNVYVISLDQAMKFVKRAYMILYAKDISNLDGIVV